VGRNEDQGTKQDPVHYDNDNERERERDEGSSIGTRSERSPSSNPKQQADGNASPDILPPLALPVPTPLSNLSSMRMDSRVSSGSDRASTADPLLTTRNRGGGETSQGDKRQDGVDDDDVDILMEM
jgi:hypothetical protein